MITDALTGWLLHKRMLVNEHVLLTFFTRERGLLRAYVQGTGARKKLASLSMFTKLWMVFDERKYGSYVRQVESISASHTLLKHHLFAGLYVNELLYHVLQQNEHEPALFDAYEHIVHYLSGVFTSDVLLERALRRFEWVLLQVSGSHVSYVHEVGGVLPLVETKQYQFTPGEGFIAVDQGYDGAHLLAMADGAWDRAEVLKTAKYILRRAIDHLLEGRPIHSRALYREAMH